MISNEVQENGQCMPALDISFKSEEIKMEKYEQYELEKLEQLIKSEIDIKFETVEQQDTEILISSRNVKSQLEQNEQDRFESTQYVKEEEEFCMQATWTCCLCDFECKQKDILRDHYNTNHKHHSNLNFFKCSLCPYSTRYFYQIVAHEMRHKNPPEPQCERPETCEVDKDRITKDIYSNNSMDVSSQEVISSQTNELEHIPKSPIMKNKNNTTSKKHVHINSTKVTFALVHGDSSEDPIYKCASCDYTTKHKTDLWPHQLKHIEASEPQMHKCDSCPFETKYKNNLKLHRLKHTDPLQVRMYTCDLCGFKTKYMQNHQLVHKGATEAQMYSCDSCGYKCKLKEDLAYHKLVHKHKDSPKTRRYKCDLCDFTTEFDSKLKSHQLKHADPLKVQMYTCDICDFKTKYKRSLASHRLSHSKHLKHANHSAARMYKCDLCDFTAKFDSILKAHQLKHADPSKVQMYTCDICGFKTKYERSLPSHRLNHADPLDIQSYKCEKCNYQTRYMKNLRRHELLIHTAYRVGFDIQS